MHEFQVKPNTAIFVDGQKARFIDLKAGDCFNITFERSAAGKRLALRIETVGEVAEGIVEGKTEDSVTVISNDGDTHKLKPGSWVFVNGKKAKIADLKAKMKVALHKPAGKPAFAIVAAAGPKVTAVFKKLDGKKVAVTLPDTSMYAEAIVAADALVWFDDKRGKLSDLRPGMAVTLQMSAATDASEVVAILGTKK